MTRKKPEQALYYQWKLVSSRMTVSDRAMRHLFQETPNPEAVQRTAPGRVFAR